MVRQKLINIYKNKRQKNNKGKGVKHGVNYFNAMS